MMFLIRLVIDGLRSKWNKRKQQSLQSQGWILYLKGLEGSWLNLVSQEELMIKKAYLPKHRKRGRAASSLLSFMRNLHHIEALA